MPSLAFVGVQIHSVGFMTYQGISGKGYDRFRNLQSWNLGRFLQEAVPCKVPNLANLAYLVNLVQVCRVGFPWVPRFSLVVLSFQ